MGLLPSAFVGNAGQSEFAPIVGVANEFYDIVTNLVLRRGYGRAFVPLLRQPNIHILADMQSIHLMFTLESAGGMPNVSATDLIAQGVTRSISGKDACTMAQRDLGWRACAAITFPRSLTHMTSEERIPALRTEAEDYLAVLVQEAEQERANQEARALLAIPSGDVPHGLLTGVKAALTEVPHEHAVFVMMRYREGENHAAIEAAITSTLARFGLTARFAKDKAYSDDLWENVRIYMHTCKYGIAVFEEIDERSFNPNVAMELGYMYALSRRVLLLKDKRMPAMPTDVIGRIYRPFDTYHIADTIGQQIDAWAQKDLGLSPQTPRASVNQPASTDMANPP